MRWSVSAGRGHEAEGAELAERLGLEVDATGDDGIVLVGSDAELAALARRVGTSVPILHAPPEPTDFARMFASSFDGIGTRLATGQRYPADLGIARSGDVEIPFVAHGVASRTGRVPRAVARRSRIELTARGEQTVHRASGVLIANAQHLGGWTVAPRAAVMDGRAEYQVLDGALLHRIRVQRAMVRGLHLGAGGIRRRPFTEVRLGMPASWTLALDGVPAGPGDWTVSILPGAWIAWV